MLDKTALISMLQLQDEINLVIDPCWRGAKRPFLRAAMMEAAEAVEHHGWKWWKKQALDMPQLQLEIVDIWHFMLSQWIIDFPRKDYAEVATGILSLPGNEQESVDLDGVKFDLSTMGLLDKLHLMVGLFACQRSSIPLIDSILTSCGMSWDDLTRQYIGKNTLNTFRQRHGYQDGHYHKIWHGREDNEHMLDLLETLDANSPTAADSLLDQLSVIYLSVLAAAAITRTA